MVFQWREKKECVSYLRCVRKQVFIGAHFSLHKSEEVSFKNGGRNGKSDDGACIERILMTLQIERENFFVLFFRFRSSVSGKKTAKWQQAYQNKWIFRVKNERKKNFVHFKRFANLNRDCDCVFVEKLRDTRNKMVSVLVYSVFVGVIFTNSLNNTF